MCTFCTCTWGSRNSILDSSLSAWLSTCFLARALLRPLSSTVVDTPYRCSSYMWKMHVFGSKITLRTCSERGTFYIQKTKIITIILLHTQARLVLCVCCAPGLDTGASLDRHVLYMWWISYSTADHWYFIIISMNWLSHTCAFVWWLW